MCYNRGIGFRTAHVFGRGLFFFYPKLFGNLVNELCQAGKTVAPDGLCDKLRQIPRLSPRSVCVALAFDNPIELVLRVGFRVVPFQRVNRRPEILLRLLL